jgi:hypothetical protein
LLLANLFLKFFVALDVSDFSGVPRFAKQQATLFGVNLPERVSDTRERSCAQRLVVECAGIARERDEQWARLHATLSLRKLFFC